MMFAIMIPFLARMVGPRLAKPFAWALIAAVALAMLYGAYSAIYSRGVHAERDRWETKIAAANAKAKATDDAAKTVAAAERVNDAATNAEQQKDYSNAIEQAKPGAPSDASVALSCERLRRAGRDTTAFPACRGR